MQVVHDHILSMADLEREGLHTVVKQMVGERLSSNALSRLGGMDVNFKSYDLVLKLLVDKGIHFGRVAGVECTRFSLRAICKVCYGGLPLARTRANYNFKERLVASGICDNLRHACLYCLIARNICVLESEWHYIFHCPLFTDLRTGSLFQRRAAEVVSEFNSFPRPCDVLCRILPLCIKEPVMANQLGSFIRLSLRVRERWLNETVSGGLHIDPAVRSNAQLHSVTLAFADGVAVSL
jgi:hypothetical protein